MSEEKLNKKLALWAGFKTVRGRYYGINAPNGEYVATPNFTQSLDVCFKWLVPKLDNVVIAMNVAPSGDVFWNARIEAEYKTANTSETPALALCLAIEKLIDLEVSHE